MDIQTLFVNAQNRFVVCQAEVERLQVAAGFFALTFEKVGDEMAAALTVFHDISKDYFETVMASVGPLPDGADIKIIADGIADLQNQMIETSCAVERILMGHPELDATKKAVIMKYHKFMIVHASSMITNASMFVALKAAAKLAASPN